jgi:hypothetical protein
MKAFAALLLPLLATLLASAARFALAMQSWR